ncbi:MAG: DnaT-like ssDNA-binding domain-containing protein, partial [Pseudomonadales bacterium]
MTESLIPERPIIVSPSLATSIGLEEAILLQHLETVLALGAGETRDGYHWTGTQLSTLTEQLPFWTAAALRRILNNLIDLGMVLVQTMPNDENQPFELTINQQVRYQKQQSHQSTATGSLGAQRIAANWRPDRAILDQLNQQGIDFKFVEANIDEFVFYWRERNEASHAWSSKFLQHVSRRWQTHQHHLQEAAAKLVKPAMHQTPIAKQWQPSPDAIEILERMGINRNFIDDAVAEFILYWQERKEAQSTWNSKFVNHVKRQWARFTHTLKHDTEPRP